MGAKTCFIAFSDGNPAEILRSQPILDRARTNDFVARFHSGLKLTSIADSTLAEAYPKKNEVFAGCFPGLSIIATDEVALDRPSQIPTRYLHAVDTQYVYVHAMHSVVDWFAYAIWKDRKLIRSLSVSPDNGVIEDIGEHRQFELEYWSGSRSIEDDEYPLKFHPLEFGESALLDLFGFQLEGDEAAFDPFSVSVCGFRKEKKFLGIF